MKQRLSPFTVLLASLLVGCATTGSLESLRENHNQAEAEVLWKQAKVDAATRAAAEAEAKRTAAGKALATGLVQAATDDVKAAEAAKERAKAKRVEACQLDPTLPECKAAQPAPAPAQASPPEVPKATTQPVPTPAPKAEPAPAQTPPAPAVEAPQAEPEPEPAKEEEAELPHAHIRLTKKGDKTELAFTEAPPKDWEVSWKFKGTLVLKIGGKEKFEVKTVRLGEGCWKLFQSGTVTKEECPKSN